MKIHRFFIADTRLEDRLLIDQPEFIWQWTRVLRFRPGQHLVLFNGQGQDRTFQVTNITKNSVQLELVADNLPLLPDHDTYLFWSLLKKDKNDWVLQKCTELGVTHFVPLLAERSEKTGFHVERAMKIVIEALEQCGRSDTVEVLEPLRVEQALEAYAHTVELYIGEQGHDAVVTQSSKSRGILIGPEGGWSDSEKDLFKTHDLQLLALSAFTLRAETACVAAATKLVA